MQLDVVKLRPDAVLPEYQTAGAAGADLHACMDEPIILQPLERKVIPTGLAMSIPEGFEVQIRARSGMSIKHGITMVNGIGTIDADYRGEVGVLAINLSQEAFTIEPGMRIAQMVLARYEVARWNEVEVLDETERGAGGYGSSGH
jgi:dUTP pyrophosphatase